MVLSISQTYPYRFHPAEVEGDCAAEVGCECLPKSGEYAKNFAVRLV